MALGNAWMLHKSGTVIPVGIHPYGTGDWNKLQNALEASWFYYDLIKRNRVPNNGDVCESFVTLAIIFLRSVKDSKKIYSKNDIKKLKTNRPAAYLSLYKYLEDDFDYLYNFKNSDSYDTEETLNTLKKEMNQNFCRVRYGGELISRRGDNSICFRISSAEVDWYKQIKEMLEDLMLLSNGRIDSSFIEREDLDTGKFSFIRDGNKKIWNGDDPKDFLNSDCRTVENANRISSTLLPYPYHNGGIREEIADLIREGYSPIDICLELRIFCMRVYQYIDDLLEYDISYNQ